MSSPRGSGRPAAFGFSLATLARRATTDQGGSTAVEYALIAAGIGAAVAATVYSVGITAANLVPMFSNWF